MYQISTILLQIPVTVLFEYELHDKNNREIYKLRILWYVFLYRYAGNLNSCYLVSYKQMNIICKKNTNLRFFFPIVCNNRPLFYFGILHI